MDKQKCSLIHVCVSQHVYMCISLSSHKFELIMVGVSKQVPHNGVPMALGQVQVEILIVPKCGPSVARRDVGYDEDLAEETCDNVATTGVKVFVFNTAKNVNNYQKLGTLLK